MLFMETIQLQRKRVKKFKLEDKELMLAIDSTSINHFQRTHKKGFLKTLQEIQDMGVNGDLPIYELIQVLGSCTHYMTGQPVGIKFFKNYDDFDIVTQLAPELFGLFESNMPKAKDESEKK